MSNFITFGCWNKGNCNPGDRVSNPLSRVIAKMNSYIPRLSIKPSFICVAGDNYYPDIHIKKVDVDGEETDKKIKTLSIANLKSGFDCLKQFHERHQHIPIDIISGNHDIENTNKMTVVQIPGSTPLTEPCIITKAEIESTMHHRMMKFTMFNYRIIKNTLVIMIDSNIYQEDLDSAKLNCYALLLDHTLSTLKLKELHDGSPITDVSQLKDIQKNWLSTVYASISRINFANVVIVAHHPFALYKVKNKTCRYDIVKPDYLNFCHSIYKHLRDNNNSRHFFYSCADLHTYQSGIVTINIENDPITISQEIVGTGGTDLETEIAEMECPSRDKRGSTLSYKMTIIHHSHGFLHWSIEKKLGRLVARFIPIDSHSSIHKSKRKISSRRSSSERSSSERSSSERSSSGGTKRPRQRTSKRGRSKRQRRSRSRH
jgi:hypothetical protein